MKILVACEESQAVCKAFRKRGHEAYSCDLQRCSGGHPEWHILDNALNALGGGTVKMQSGKWLEVDHWDLIIAHPPCTYLSNVATRHHSIQFTPIKRIEGRTLERIHAMEFFMRCIQAPCKHIAVENPVCIMSTAYRKPDQIIEPYEFAEGTEDVENYVTKRTCLWLKGLPRLKGGDLPRPDNLKLYGKHEGSNKARTWEDVRHGNVVRSKTFPGIAKAMADQWGAFLERECKS